MPPKKKPPFKKAPRQKRPYGGRPSLKEAAQLQDRILDAAAELFIKHGYGETSIEAIAAHAGIGKLTLYRRFGDKDALFQAVVLRLAEQSRGMMFGIDESEGSLSDILTTVGRRMLSIVLSPVVLAFHRIVFAEAARLPELCARLRQFTTTETQDPIPAFFRRLADRGALRSDDVALLHQQFTQTIIGQPLRNALLGALPMSTRAQEEHVRKAVELFLHGAAKPSPR